MALTTRPTRNAREMQTDELTGGRLTDGLVMFFDKFLGKEPRRLAGSQLAMAINGAVQHTDWLLEKTNNARLAIPYVGTGLLETVDGGVFYETDENVYGKGAAAIRRAAVQLLAEYIVSQVSNGIDVETDYNNATGAVKVTVYLNDERAKDGGGGAIPAGQLVADQKRAVNPVTLARLTADALTSHLYPLAGRSSQNVISGGDELTILPGMSERGLHRHPEAASVPAKYLQLRTRPVPRISGSTVLSRKAHGRVYYTNITDTNVTYDHAVARLKNAHGTAMAALVLSSYLAGSPIHTTLLEVCGTIEQQEPLADVLTPLPSHQNYWSELHDAARNRRLMASISPNTTMGVPACEMLLSRCTERVLVALSQYREAYSAVRVFEIPRDFICVTLRSVPSGTKSRIAFAKVLSTLRGVPVSILDENAIVFPSALSRASAGALQQQPVFKAAIATSATTLGTELRNMPENEYWSVSEYGEYRNHAFTPRPPLVPSPALPTTLEPLSAANASSSPPTPPLPPRRLRPARLLPLTAPPPPPPPPPSPPPLLPQSLPPIAQTTSHPSSQSVLSSIKSFDRSGLRNARDDTQRQTRPPLLDASDIQSIFAKALATRRLSIDTDGDSNDGSGDDDDVIWTDTKYEPPDNSIPVPAGWSWFRDASGTPTFVAMTQKPPVNKVDH